MQKILGVLIVLTSLIGCTDTNKPVLREGLWRAELALMDNKVLPYTFSMARTQKGNRIEIYNAREVITADEVEITGDSVVIRMPVYEGYIAATFTDTTMQGSFIKESLERTVPFRAIHDSGPRFTITNEPTTDVSGVWEAEFSAGTAESYPAKGIFEQQESLVTGTFRTTTGDYRYLEGVMDGDSLKLSTFDGAHAFLFLAKYSDSLLQGTFYSGNHFKEPFVSRPNASFELPDADSLTYFKEGYDKLSFSFPDSDGTMVSLEDPRFKNKVVIVQIMGSWCPNCLDETKFLVEYLATNDNPSLEVVALAFEYAKTEALAFKSIERLRNRIDVNYPVLLAQYGTSNKLKANEKLPMLNHVLSYPTTIFIDKEGKVRKIHTGFNGPATGGKYLDFKRDFKDFVSQLLSE